MRKVARLPLSKEAERFLATRTAKVAKAADPKTEAIRLWGQRGASAFDEVLVTLRKMASGVERCMYCEDSAGTDIEHFRPKAGFPDRAYRWDNYLLACSSCNSNYKRDRFPLDGAGEPLLIDPSSEDPRAHLELAPRAGKYVALTEKGRQSIDVFGLARGVLERGRQDAWVSVQALIVHYATRRREAEALDAQRALCNFPHASVFVVLLDVARSPAARQFITQRCLTALGKHPEIFGWV